MPKFDSKVIPTIPVTQMRIESSRSIAQQPLRTFWCKAASMPAESTLRALDKITQWARTIPTKGGPRIAARS